MKTITAFTVAVLLIALMTPRPAEALNAETAGWLAYIGAAIIIQVVYVIVAKRPQPVRPKDGTSGLPVCVYSEEDAGGCREDMALPYVTAKLEAPQSP